MISIPAWPMWLVKDFAFVKSEFVLIVLKSHFFMYMYMCEYVVVKQENANLGVESCCLGFVFLLFESHLTCDCCDDYALYCQYVLQVRQIFIIAGQPWILLSGFKVTQIRNL